MKLNEVYVGDCIELLKQLDAESIDLVVTSPPYNDMVSYGNKIEILTSQDYVKWMTDVFNNLCRVLKNTGSIILNINDNVKQGERQHYVYELVASIINNTDLKFFDRYIWFKKSALPWASDDRRLNDRIEYIFHFVKDVKEFKTFVDRVRLPYQDSSLNRFFAGPVIGNARVDSETGLRVRKRTKKYSDPHPLGIKPITVFQFPTNAILKREELNSFHPAPFHPDLPEFFIKWLSDLNDIVLDPFAGSGTTCYVALRQNRRWLGFDANPSYIENAKKRIRGSL